MTIGLSQRLLISLLKFVVNILWFVDSLTLPAVKVTKKFLLASSLALTEVLFFGVIFSVAKNVSNTFTPYKNITILHQNVNPDLQVLGAFTPVRPNPVKVNEMPVPQITAQSAYVIDQKNAKVLYENNQYKRLAPASTTKLMTALVSLEEHSLDDTISIPKECTETESSRAGFPAGTKFKVKDLVYSLLISSSGDAACALSFLNGSYSDFVWKMNKKASQIGMTNTYFTNPIGLDDANGFHYSTAVDLYKLSFVSMQNSSIKDAVRTKEYMAKSAGGSFIASLVSTNRLLWDIPQSVGIKTGTTAAAGEVLIYEYKDDKKDLVIIVMGSSDRFSDTRALLNWALASYSWF